MYMNVRLGEIIRYYWRYWDVDFEMVIKCDSREWVRFIFNIVLGFKYVWIMFVIVCKLKIMLVIVSC